MAKKIKNSTIKDDNELSKLLKLVVIVSLIVALFYIITIFVNKKELFHFSYQRYLVNQIRKEFGLEGTPVRIIVREKGEKE